jgi:hypothetical protein
MKALKELNKLRCDLQEDITRARNLISKDPEIGKLHKELVDAEKRYDELVLKRRKEMVDPLTASLAKIDEEIKELKTSLSDKYAPTGKIKEILDRCMRGTDWGSKKPFSIKWISDDEQFFIVTLKGHNGWSGRGCTNYNPSEHYLMDVSKDDKNEQGYTLWKLIKVGLEVEGRLTKEKQEELIKRTINV